MAATAAAVGIVANGAPAARGAAIELSADEVDLPKAWRATAPSLYELFIGCGLEWPALSVAWLPDEPQERPRIAIGLHTDGVPSEVVVVELTCDRCRVEGIADPDDEGGGGDEESTSLWRSWSLEGLGDTEAFGCDVADDSGAAGPLRTVARLQHPTEVNRVAACPSRPQLLATKAASGAVLLFDYKAERPAGSARPDASLVPRGGSVADGFALDWSSGGRPLLASGGNDGRLCVWAVDASLQAQATYPLYEVDQAHAGPLCAATFAPPAAPATAASLVATAGDDGFLRVWDLRTGPSVRSATKVSHADVLTADWNSLQGHWLCTAGKDSQVCVWDLRSMQRPLRRLQAHNGDVVAARWAPFRSDVLGSCGQDGRVNLWDLAASARDPADDDDASPELFFAHDGHQAPISDFSWTDADEYLLVSVSEDNRLQIWQPHPATYLPDSEGEADSDEGGQEPAPKRSRPDGGE